MYKTFYLEATSENPYENLAIEDAIISYCNERKNAEEDILGLFLWQSRKAVVLGRNQSASREVDLDLLYEEEVDLVRRRSGGGAVYQDLGNLNYSFFYTGEEYRENPGVSLLIASLHRLGIASEASGRNDILVDGFKVSGTAYRTVDSVHMTHGTLLISEDLLLAERILTPDDYKLRSKGIQSVASRIRNLSDFLPDLTVESVIDTIHEEFDRTYADENDAIDLARVIDPAQVDKIRQTLCNPDWIYGKPLSSYELLQGRWGSLYFSIVERDGAILDFLYEGDILEVERMECFRESLRGMSLTEKGIIEREEEVDSALELAILERMRTMLS